MSPNTPPSFGEAVEQAGLGEALYGVAPSADSALTDATPAKPPTGKLVFRFMPENSFSLASPLSHPGMDGRDKVAEVDVPTRQ